jgi:hypothetical protein
MKKAIFTILASIVVTAINAQVKTNKGTRNKPLPKPVYKTKPIPRRITNRRPDLKIISVQYDQKTNLSSNKRIKAKVVVQNLGSATAKNIRLAITMNGSSKTNKRLYAYKKNQYISGQQFRGGIAKIAELKPKAKKVVNLIFYTPGNFGNCCKTKKLYPLVWIDPTNRIIESNENNNKKIGVFSLNCKPSRSVMTRTPSKGAPNNRTNTTRTKIPAKTRTAANRPGATRDRINTSTMTSGRKISVKKPNRRNLAAIKTASLKMPGYRSRQPIKYVVKNSKAIYQGDIELGPKSKLNNMPKVRKLPTKRNLFNEYTQNGIVAGKRLKAVVRGDNNGDGQLDADNESLWNNGVVDYRIGPNVSRSLERDIRAAIATLEQRTNLNFEEIAADFVIPALNPAVEYQTGVRLEQLSKNDKVWRNSFINFEYRANKDSFTASSPVGRCARINRIKFGPAAGGENLVIHEILHSLGFYHEHARSDRDRFVTLLPQNIRDGAEGNFETMRPGEYFLSEQFDFNSVMMYGSGTFANPGTNTMVIRSNDQNNNRSFNSGQSSGLSPLDIDAINTLYPVNTKRGFNNIGLQSSFKLKVNVLEIGITDGDQDANWNPVSDPADDLFLKVRIGGGWNWRPNNQGPKRIQTSPRSIKRFDGQSVTRKSRNSFGWNIVSPIIANNQNLIKVFIGLWEYDNTSGDEFADVNPMPNAKEVGLLINMQTKEIYFNNGDGTLIPENYLGTLGEPLSILQGFEQRKAGDLLGYLGLQIEVL